MYARISPTSCILEIWLLIFLRGCKFGVISDEELWHPEFWIVPDESAAVED